MIQFDCPTCKHPICTDSGTEEMLCPKCGDEITINEYQLTDKGRETTET